MIIGLISLISAINIFNIIYSNIILRKREFAILRGMGMSQKQISKMLSIEGIFYGAKACMYGIVISLLILVIMYYNIEDYNYYKLSIPWGNIGLCIIVVYSIIFFATWYAKRKIRTNNIIDEIRNENV